MLVLAAVLLATGSHAAPFSLGDQLHRSVGSYEALPITLSDAASTGWSTRDDTCVPGRGVTLWLADDSPNTDNPLALGFNPHTGALVSVSVLVDGGAPANLVKSGWWEHSLSRKYATVTVGLRPFGDACNATMITQALPLGDRVVVNPGKLDWMVPRTASDPSLAANYTRGACIAKMGVHWIHDVVAAPKMSWDANNFAPIVPMYDDHDGLLNAIFFGVPKVQQGLTSAHNWDGVPLVNKLMCENFCDKSCTFANTHFWSTLHLYFRDMPTKTCDTANLDCDLLGSCCPKN